MDILKHQRFMRTILSFNKLLFFQLINMLFTLLGSSAPTGKRFLLRAFYLNNIFVKISSTIIWPMYC